MARLASKQLEGEWTAARFVGRVVASLVSQTLSAVILLPIVVFAGYDLAYFQTRTDEIRHLLASASEEERNPTETMAGLIRVAHHHRVATAAARILVSELNAHGNGMASWHLTNGLWWMLVSLHLSEREQIVLVASRTRNGYSAASQSLFQRPLTALSADEVATVVAFVSGIPNLYRQRPELLAQRRDYLLSKVQSAPSLKE